jgi:hypothetical protein
MDGHLDIGRRAFQGLIELAAVHLAGAYTAGNFGHTRFLRRIGKGIALGMGIPDSYCHGMTDLLVVIGAVGNIT